MPPPPDRDRGPGGAQSLVDAPGDELREAESRDVGGITDEGAVLPTAATQAGAMRRRFQGLSVGTWLAIGWLAIVLFVTVFAPLLPVGDPNDTVHLKHPCPTVQRFGRTIEQCTINGRGPFAQDGGARGYPLGGDTIGRSMLARLAYGARTSVVVSVGAVMVGFLIGGALGLIAGYFGGRIDTIISGAMNVLLSLPAIILALALVAFLQPPSSETGGKNILPSEVVLIIAIGVVAIPLLGRITRGSTLAWSQREFVLAARAQGAKNFRVMIREVLPNVLPAMFSIALLGIAVAMVAEGALSILGLGVRPPTPSWGNIIGAGRTELEESPHIVLEPSILIFFTVLALNYLGDVVRERFDVREAGI